MTDNTCANPLLLGWIKEWLDEARQRNSKGVTTYKRAYESMKACPLTFSHPSEAQQLNGLGPKLCNRLAEKLKQHCDENGLQMPELPQKGKKRPSGEGNELQEKQPVKKAKKVKPYVPALRSGAYGLLLGLATLDANSSLGLTKAQLIEVAQPYCDVSFTAPPDPTKFYTAWNSMKTLVQKDLVYEHGRPLRRYILTEEGWEIARRIQKTTTQGDSASVYPHATSQTYERVNVIERQNDHALSKRIPDVTFSSSPVDRTSDLRYSGAVETANSDFIDLESSANPSPPEQIPIAIPAAASAIARSTRNDKDAFSVLASLSPIILPPDSFTVELVLDVREIRTSKDRDYIANELSKKGITPIVRALELGDALWVAKCKDPSFLARHGEDGDEVMLDWIVERKRLDDLIGSIKDGRFHEQKFRLRRSGVQNVVYLIEDFSICDSSSAGALRYQDAVASAIASTQVVNGYFVKKTRNLDDTIRYLTRMTRLLQRKYGRPSSLLGTRLPPQTLSIIPTEHITSSRSYLLLLKQLHNSNKTHAETVHTITFTAFSTLSSKSDMLALRDIFLKMLMCTRGVSGEKALEIQRRWRTPREFVEAFESLGDVAREGMVFSQLGGLVGRKKIARTLSKTIADVWS